MLKVVCRRSSCLWNASNSDISQIKHSLLIRYQELHIYFSDYKHFSNKFNNFRWLNIILYVHIPQLAFLRNSLFMKIVKWEFKTWWKIITSNKEKENVCWKAKLNDWTLGILCVCRLEKKTIRFPNILFAALCSHLISPSKAKPSEFFKSHFEF